MDLLKEPWLPVVLDSQQQRKISLSDILDNQIRDLACPRADFQGAAWQLLIGLLQCTVAPEDGDDWQEVWQQGIDSQQWQRSLATVSSAFQFGAEKPSFLQSFEPLETSDKTIAGLLIETPGEQTLKQNKDLFTKRNVGRQICPHCAALALFTIQTNSPAGGAGYRTGLRGGGPLTTLVMPEDASLPLWKKLWLNVLPGTAQPQPDKLALIFPWLAATQSSEKKGSQVTPQNSHPLQLYWGMPQRIELDFSQTQQGECQLCGEYHSELLSQMRTKNYGVQYDGWVHPLSPYRQALKDKGGLWLALKGQPGGLCYQDWLGLTLTSEDKFNLTQPAKVVRELSNYYGLPPTYLWCFAWDMDNAKARCWYQHRVPLIHSDEQQQLADVLTTVLQLADNARLLLKKWLKEAWFSSPGEVKGSFGWLDNAFWQQTEGAFRRLLPYLQHDPARAKPGTRQALRQWEQALSGYLFDQFDREAFTDPDSDNQTLSRQLAARGKLERFYFTHKLRKEVITLASEPEAEDVAK